MKEFYPLLNEFANDLTVAENIEVKIYESGMSLTPRHVNEDARYEDAEMIHSLVRGAEALCYYLGRNGYEIKKGK